MKIVGFGENNQNIIDEYALTSETIDSYFETVKLCERGSDKSVMRPSMQKSQSLKTSLKLLRYRALFASTTKQGVTKIK